MLLGFHSVMSMEFWRLFLTISYVSLKSSPFFSNYLKSAKDKSVRLINWIIVNVLAFFYRNIADPEDWLCLQLIGLPILNYLLVWREACVCLLHLFCQNVNWRNENWVLQTEERHSWVTSNLSWWKSSLFFDSLKLAYRQLLSLFTAFTLVQLRSLLQSKCW